MKWYHWAVLMGIAAIWGVFGNVVWLAIVCVMAAVCMPLILWLYKSH